MPLLAKSVQLLSSLTEQNAFNAKKGRTLTRKEAFSLKNNLGRASSVEKAVRLATRRNSAWFVRRGTSLVRMIVV